MAQNELKGQKVPYGEMRDGGAGPESGRLTALIQRNPVHVCLRVKALQRDLLHPLAHVGRGRGRRRNGIDDRDRRRSFSDRITA